MNNIARKSTNEHYSIRFVIRSKHLYSLHYTSNRPHQFVRIELCFVTKAANFVKCLQLNFDQFEAKYKGGSSRNGSPGATVAIGKFGWNVEFPLHRKRETE